MARTQQVFVNEKDSPIYISVEPWPECFELEPGDKLTLIWTAPDGQETADIRFCTDRELVVWPAGPLTDIQYLINGEPAAHRSWHFKHPLEPRAY